MNKQEDDKPFTVPISEDSFETHEFEPPSYRLETTKKELRQLYIDMNLIRCVHTLHQEKDN
jgi:pyruvate dehydrogenase E1 component alpha subunit